MNKFITYKCIFIDRKLYFKINIGLALIYLSKTLPMKSLEFENDDKKVPKFQRNSDRHIPVRKLEKMFPNSS